MSSSDQEDNEAWTWSNKGAQYFTNGEYEEVLKAYDKALEINPNHREAQINKVSALESLAIAYRDKGQHEDAIKYFDMALKLDPNDAGRGGPKLSVLRA